MLFGPDRNALAMISLSAGEMRLKMSAIIRGIVWLTGWLGIMWLLGMPKDRLWIYGMGWIAIRLLFATDKELNLK